MALIQKKKLLGEYLIEQGKIDKTALNVSLQEQIVTGEPLGKILVRFGLISQAELDDALMVIAPDKVTGGDKRNSKLSVDFLIKNQTMIVVDTENLVRIATLSKDPVRVREQVAMLCGKKVEFAPVSHREILSYLANLGRGEETYRQHLSLEHDVNKVIDAILLEGYNLRASDIHIESSAESIRVRLRIDGILSYAQTLPKAMADKLFSRIKGMAGLDESEKRKPQDGDFSVKVGGKSVDYRVSTLPTVHGERIALRVLDRDQLLLRMDSLGLVFIEEYKRLTMMANGLIIVAGATGSGKTTMLYSTMANLNKHERSILTMEDPVEYKLEFITQCEANDFVNFGFDQFPRTALRQDPDVILIGEMRDRMTANATVNLADTGHLVFSTLHTRDVRQTVARMEALGVPRTSLADLLRGVLVLRLVRKICQNCKGAGCDACRDSGYYGRTLLAEFASISSPGDVAAILDGTLKYHTFADDARLKVAAGITDWKEVERVSERDAADVDAYAA
ncbi:GspE/PulE family protein [Geomonas subterranea]|uniref:GspE/PulE family protein n=1 Tax=Geomonas subterranea TaxID=2847989 RepID=UPI001CD1C5A0|nr:GspE/PulE family protein [Geomonas fuzhouensis]